MIPKKRFLDQVSDNLTSILRDDKLSNYIGQLRSLSLGGAFNHTFEENYIWDRAYYLANYGTLILLNEESENVDLGNKAILKAAEIFEYLSKVSKSYDAQYIKILSAFCYDISGYQANAFSMLANQDSYIFEQTNEELLSIEELVLKETNYVVEMCYLILQKKLSLAKVKNTQHEVSSSYLYDFQKGMECFLAAALLGEENQSLQFFEKAYLDSFKSGNTVANTLINLLNIRIKLFNKRSIWKFVESAPPEQNYIWKKYVKIIANSIYDGNRVKKIEKRISRFELWNSQLEALNRGVITSSSSFILQMPTSAGKTMIAEMAIVDVWAKNLLPKAKILYIAPFRALVSQVESDLSASLNKLDIRVSSISGGYEYDIFDDLMVNDSDVLVTTPEKVELLLRVNKEYFNNLKLMIFDEGHIIGGDDKRAALSELLITKFKYTFPDLKKIFISAVISDHNSGQLARWISENVNNVAKSPFDINGQQWSPTRKLISEFLWKNEVGNIYYKDIKIYSQTKNREVPVFVSSIVRQESYQYRNPFTNRLNTLKFPKNFITKSQTAATLAYKISDDGPTLIFCSRADWALNVVKAINEYFSFLRSSNTIIKENFNHGSQSDSYRISCEWYGEDHEITKCIYNGIGIHFGKMIKSLRHAVEKDFKSGKLRVLISTNTVGQGLNFPIKNLIIHSVEINPQQIDYKAISVRDFWNVVGRAGRANKETEGQVIFLINNKNDRELYNRYTNVENIEKLESYFVTLLNNYLKNRISDVEYLNELSSASEATILQLLCEESLSANIENVPNVILSNSLVGIQLDDDINLTMYKNDLQAKLGAISIEIHRKVEREKMKVFSETGLPIEVCQNIWTHIEGNIEVLSNFLSNNDFIEIIKFLEKYLHNFDYALLDMDDLTFIKEMPYNFYEVVLGQWVSGTSSRDILAFWKANSEIEISYLTLLISSGFEYVLPWLSTGILKILEFKFKNIIADDFKLSEDLISFPTFLKYGADNKYSCFLILMGMNSRDLAVKIIKETNFTTFKELTDWLGVVTFFDLKSLHLMEHEIREVYEVSYKLGGKNYYDIFTNQIAPIQFFIAGISWDVERKKLSELINVGNRLNLERDFENEFDSYAIKVTFGNLQLGFIPREEARFISNLIDVENFNFQLDVVGTIPTAGNWKNIKVKLIKI